MPDQSRTPDAREHVRMRVSITFDYDAPIDPSVYEGSTDPMRMAEIDADNPIDALLELASAEPEVSIMPASPSLPDSGEWSQTIDRLASVEYERESWAALGADAPLWADATETARAPYIERITRIAQALDASRPSPDSGEREAPEEREVLLRSVVESLEVAYSPQLVKVDGEHPADFVRRRFGGEEREMSATQQRTAVSIVLPDGRRRRGWHEPWRRLVVWKELAEADPEGWYWAHAAEGEVEWVPDLMAALEASLGIEERGDDDGDR